MATTALQNPVPVRLNKSEDAQLTTISAETGLTKSEILRRACRYAFPKFISGEVNVAKVAELDAVKLSDEHAPRN